MENKLVSILLPTFNSEKFITQTIQSIQEQTIVDWELSTVGDPMIDLGWLMATWRGQGADDPGSPIVIEPWSGFPTAAELVDCYAERTGADVSQARWYGVLACYKLGLLLEGTFARTCAGQADQALACASSANGHRGRTSKR